MRAPICALAVCTAAFCLCAVALASNHMPQKSDSTKRDNTVLYNPALREELLQRRDRDQAIREEITKKGLQNPDKILFDRMQDIDEENTDRMAEIIRRYGWPGPDMVGTDGMEAAFLLVQHANPDFQREVLPIIKRAFLDGVLPGKDYALLLDRVLLSANKPQYYGTQAQIKGHEIVLDPIQDEANVDKRRAEVGLPPLAEYLKELRQIYFPDEKQK